MRTTSPTLSIFWSILHLRNSLYLIHAIPPKYSIFNLRYTPRPPLYFGSCYILDPLYIFVRSISLFTVWFYLYYSFPPRYFPTYHLLYLLHTIACIAPIPSLQFRTYHFSYPPLYFGASHVHTLLFLCACCCALWTLRGRGRGCVSCISKHLVVRT